MLSNYWPVLLSLIVICHVELGQCTRFPSDGNGFDGDVRKNEEIHPFPRKRSRPVSGQSEAPTARPRYLWPSTRAPAWCWRGGERESGRALSPGTTQTQRNALGTDWACLMERGQSSAWAAGRRAGHSRTQGHHSTGAAVDRQPHVQTHTHTSWSSDGWGESCRLALGWKEFLFWWSLWRSENIQEFFSLRWQYHY